MPRSTVKKKSRTPPTEAPVSPPLNPLRPGMPAQDSIVGVKQMKKGGKIYRIIKTSEIDAYDDVPAPSRRRRKRSK